MRALLGRELTLALQDCDAAFKIAGRKAAVLDSRGLVRLRMGDAAGAINDYDAALAIAPSQAWSRYGRGIARLKLGQRAEGEKDIADAKALNANVADQARRWGVIP